MMAVFHLSSEDNACVMRNLAMSLGKCPGEDLVTIDGTSMDDAVMIIHFKGGIYEDVAPEDEEKYKRLLEQYELLENN